MKEWGQLQQNLILNGFKNHYREHRQKGVCGIANARGHGREAAVRSERVVRGHPHVLPALLGGSTASHRGIYSLQKIVDLKWGLMRS